MTRYRVKARDNGDEHLCSGGHYRNDAAFQRKLNAFFLRTDGRPALERLDELGRKYRIGLAKPYITIRVLAGDRDQRMIVVRHSETSDEESTGIPAGDMTKEQARNHPGALSVLDRFAEDKLFELRITNAPATVLYSTAIMRFLATRDPSTSAPNLDQRRRELNEERNQQDPQTTFSAIKARATVLIEEFFKGRRFDRPPMNLPTEIKSFLVRKSLEAGATMNRHGQVAGALDNTVAAYVSVARQAIEWIRVTFHPPINLAMKSFKPKVVRSDALKWTACRNVMLWSQGYVWENGGFARHWVERNGDLRLEYKKLPEPQLSEHRAEFLPLLRAIPCFATTGSRQTVGSLMCWEEHDYHGHIELNGKRSRIHRTGTYGPDYANKPRITSSLTPLARAFFEVFHAKDLREAARWGWPVDWVIHNGRGGAVDDLANLFKRACEALGIKNSARKLKHLAVTMHWFAGFELRRIAKIIGTDPETTEDYYLYLEDEYAGLIRPRAEPEKMTFADFADPQRDMPKIPRAPVPPRPRACTGSEAAREVVGA